MILHIPLGFKYFRHHSFNPFQCPQERSPARRNQLQLVMNLTVGEVATEVPPE